MRRYIVIVVLSLSLGSCIAPRTVTQSGKVTPEGQFEFGGNYSGNISVQATRAIFNGIGSAIDGVSDQDSVVYDDGANDLAVAILAYSLDPLSAGGDLSLRYGIYEAFDIGYKYASGTHVFDGRWQFKGSTGTIKNPGEDRKNASVGIQFSRRSYKLPDVYKLDKLQSILGFSLKRTDIMVPLIFSYSFGKEEEVGHIAYGLVYNHSFIEYGFDPKGIFYSVINSANSDPIDAISFKKNYPSFGAFFNMKLGYRHAYLIGSLSIFYQKYGEFYLLDEQKEVLKGMTYIPSIGIQFNPWMISLRKGSKTE